jgi:hypothetical protein
MLVPVKGLRLTPGLSWLHQRRRHDFPERPGMPRAIKLQLRAPNFSTKRLRTTSSSGDHGPLMRSSTPPPPVVVVVVVVIFAAVAAFVLAADPSRPPSIALIIIRSLHLPPPTFANRFHHTVFPEFQRRTSKLWGNNIYLGGHRHLAIIMRHPHSVNY